MVLKIVGALLLMVATTMIGIELCRDYVKRIGQLQQLRKMIIILCGEIKYNNSNLKYAFQKIARNSEGFVKEFLNCIVSKMEQQPEREICEIWSEGISDNLKINTRMKDRDLMEMEEVGAFLGITDKETQINNFQLYLDKLECSIEEGEKNKEVKCKLYRTMGMMLGAFIVIAII